MTQHNDLKFFGPIRPNGKARHRSNEAIQDAKHARQDRTIFGLTKRHDRISGTHRLDWSSLRSDYAFNLDVTAPDTFLVVADGADIIVHNKNEVKTGENGVKYIELGPGDTVPDFGYKVVYVFDPATGTLIVGIAPAKSGGHNPLREAAGLGESIVGGELSKDGLTFNEASGHFGGNWDDDSRAAFKSLLDELDSPVEHAPTFDDC